MKTNTKTAAKTIITAAVKYLVLLTMGLMLLGIVLSLNGQQIGVIQQATQATDFIGTLGVTHGGTGTATALTQGAVVFAGASGVYTQDATAFWYDATNHCLAVGNNTCSGASAPLLAFRSTNGTIAVFQNTNAGNQLQLNVNNGTGSVILQNRNTANSANLPLELQTQGGTVIINPLHSTTGTRFICIDTAGTLTSSASACSGT